ncbi:hypothetical protein [Streptomyces sp. NPDC001809]
MATAGCSQTPSYGDPAAIDVGDQGRVADRGDGCCSVRWIVM